MQPSFMHRNVWAIVGTAGGLLILYIGFFAALVARHEVDRVVGVSVVVISILSWLTLAVPLIVFRAKPRRSVSDETQWIQPQPLPARLRYNSTTYPEHRVPVQRHREDRSSRRQEAVAVPPLESEAFTMGRRFGYLEATNAPKEETGEDPPAEGAPSPQTS